MSIIASHEYKNKLEHGAQVLRNLAFCPELIHPLARCMSSPYPPVAAHTNSAD